MRGTRDPGTGRGRDVSWSALPSTRQQREGVDLIAGVTQAETTGVSVLNPRCISRTSHEEGQPPTPPDQRPRSPSGLGALELIHFPSCGCPTSPDRKRSPSSRRRHTRWTNRGPTSHLTLGSSCTTGGGVRRFSRGWGTTDRGRMGSRGPLVSTTWGQPAPGGHRLGLAR